MKCWHLNTAKLKFQWCIQGGPLPVKNWVITPISRVITPATHRPFMGAHFTLLITIGLGPTSSRSISIFPFRKPTCFSTDQTFNKPSVMRPKRFLNWPTRMSTSVVFFKRKKNQHIDIGRNDGEATVGVVGVRKIEKIFGPPKHTHLKHRTWGIWKSREYRYV